MALPQALAECRRRYAAAICRIAGTPHPRVEEAFATVPRENYLVPPPWTIFSPGGFIERHTCEPADLYEDVLVVLDAPRGINNGQPSLHAAWLAAVDPQPGHTALHIGAGTGYYSAVIAALVTPGGRVHAYEIDPRLAEIARCNLRTVDGVMVHAKSGVATGLPSADLVYVNAGVAAPDAAWLHALAPAGRLVFPWQASPGSCVTMVVRRLASGFEARPWLAVGFIRCVGEKARRGGEPPNEAAIAAIRSLWLREVREPDETATAIYDEIWFSSAPPARPNRG